MIAEYFCTACFLIPAVTLIPLSIIFLLKPNTPAPVIAYHNDTVIYQRYHNEYNTCTLHLLNPNAKWICYSMFKPSNCAQKCKDTTFLSFMCLIIGCIFLIIALVIILCVIVKNKCAPESSARVHPIYDIEDFPPPIAHAQPSDIPLHRVSANDPNLNLGVNEKNNDIVLISNP